MTPLLPHTWRRLVATAATAALALAGAAWTAPTAAAATSITNGGFETGNLTGWTASGPATGVTTSTPHSGSYAAMLGSTSPTNGTSSIAQSFTAPAGSPQLSFWYDVFCPDTVTYDWASATLTDTTTNTTTTVLPKTCTNNLGWKQVSTALTAGHNYTLTLSNTDDNWPGDATYTLYDDVVITGAAADDFSISDSPTSATVNAGAAATTTVSTAVTAGAAQSISLTASGLPAGATAAFNPATVTAGGSSTLTVTTAASTPSGTYPITVTGTGTSVTHTAGFSLTVNGTGPSLIQVSSDPFTNSTSQHATEVEPDTFAYGNTIVASSQVGRFTDGGSSDISWNTSTDGGSTWRHGMLPGITTYQGGTWARVSDPSVAYDAKHGTWMITGLVIDSAVNGAGVSVNRSADGVTWQNPVMAVGNDGQGYDKEWIVCDNTTTSPYYGNCYIEVDITSSANRIVMSTSSDGGSTWSAQVSTGGNDSGLGGQPLVQPSGKVVVPFSTNGTSIRSFSSTNGGASWGASALIANVSSHTVAGGLRSGDGLPSAEIDGAGQVFVSWQDCRFRSGCSSNDIVYSTSTDGSSWSTVARVPIDATTSTVDHFIPGFGVDHATSGTTAKLGVYYYFYPNASCTSSSCQLEVGFISSANGGSTWSAAQTVAGPFPLSQIAGTTQGSMVGDYLSTSVVNGRSVAIFAVGKAPTNGQAFDEGMYAIGGGLAMQAGTTSAGADPVLYRTPNLPSGPGPVNRR